MSDAFLVQRKHLRSEVQDSLDTYTALLSLDGGGLRGLISAQVLKVLEDAIKQALWQEGLIRPDIVKEILGDPRARSLVPPASHHLLAADVAAPASEGLFEQRKALRLTLANAAHKGPGEYAKKQAALLQPPADWDVYKLCFEIDLVDWFDQLAGTSTGGLLALYLASKGGDKKKLKEIEEKEAKGRKPQQGQLPPKPRPGSAAGASDFYLNNAKTIFGTSMLAKGKNMVTSGGQYQHSADGLERVLNGVFGDLTIKDLQANVAITTVDVANARTAFFFKNYLKEGETLPFDRNDEQLQGLATSLRKGESNGVLVRRAPANLEEFAGKLNPLSIEGYPITPMFNSGDPADHSAAARAGGANVSGNSATTTARTTLLSSDALAQADEQNGGRASTALFPATHQLPPHGNINMFAINVITACGGWVAPIQFEHRNFYVVDVARATSAAPAFLPPKVLAPVGFKPTKPPGDWGTKGRTFLDGGLGNNDPVWMGLAMLLQRYNTKGLDVAAILSLGTGTTTTCTAYNPGNAGFIGNVLGFLGQAVTLGLARVSGLLGALISLTMSLNGEDKEHILRLIYYGLLRLPPGQYLRIQLKDEAREYTDPKTGKDLPDGEIKIRREALGKMDDPDDKIMQAYVRMGTDLASRFSLRLAWWVRCYVFCIDNPNKVLFLAERVGNRSGVGATPPSVAAAASLPA